MQNSYLMATSFMAVGINVIACMIFEHIVYFEKRISESNQTLGQFAKITIMQFFNIAIVVLAVNFNFDKNENGKFLGFLPIFNGKYYDFDVFWYANIGKTLCMTLLINIFSPHVSRLMMPLVKLAMRFRDRSFNS
jgi:Mg2+/citrate symporter